MPIVEDLPVTADDARLRRDLETRRRQAVEDLQRCLSRIREAEARPPDGETCEDDTSDIDVGLVDILNAMVTRIDAALERLADGAYGRCARCHHRISDARLRAMPFAVRCQACEAARERERTVRHNRPRTVRWDEGPAGA